MHAAINLRLLMYQGSLTVLVRKTTDMSEIVPLISTKFRKSVYMHVFINQRSGNNSLRLKMKTDIHSIKQDFLFLSRQRQLRLPQLNKDYSLSLNAVYRGIKVNQSII